MSVATKDCFVQYTGNASTVTPYPVPFLFLNEEDLQVTVIREDGTTQLLRYRTDYTVSGAGQSRGGSMVTLAPVPGMRKVSILRQVEATQLTSYLEGSEFPAASHEAALDKLTMLVQQEARSAGLSLRLPDTYEEIPPLEPRANTVIGLNGDSQPATYTYGELADFLNLQGQYFDRPTASFADAGEKAEAVPQFVGQLGTKRDDGTLWISNGLAAGNWVAYVSGEVSVHAAYVVVQTSSSATANGTALLNAYNTARSLTPGGSALSETNRATVILPPAEYDLGSAELVLDTAYVDLVGMTTNRRAQYVHSITGSEDGGTIHQTADHVSIENLYVANWGGATSGYSASTSAAYFPTSNLAGTRLRNVELASGGNSGGPYPTRVYVEYSGTYEDCHSEGVLFGGASENDEGTGAAASGVFLRCRGGSYSFGGGQGSVCSGTFYDCEGGLGSFGGGEGSIAAGAVLLNGRKTGDNLDDDATIDPAAQVINLADPSGIRCLPAPAVGSGAVVQSVWAVYEGNSNLGVIPADGTVPQKSEGTNVLSLSIKPKFASSKIRVRFNGIIGSNVDTTGTVALFMNSIASAIHASSTRALNGLSSYLGFEYISTPVLGSDGSVTYQLNAGGNAGITRLNGTAATRLFGTASHATLILEEIKA